MNERVRWNKLMASLGAVNYQDVFDKIAKRYAEGQRAYHNLSHVTYMLEEYEKLPHKKPTIAVAIWFHDVIYDPRSKDNEEQSAEFAQSMIRKMKLTEEFGAEVSRLILATKHDEIPQDEDAQTLVDLDLVVLGRSRQSFIGYQMRIRVEYDWVPQARFKVARSKILQSFLDRESIYLTPFFRERYELSARRNLRYALQQLHK